MPTVWNLVVSDPGELERRGLAAEHKHQYLDEDEAKERHQRALDSGMNARIEEGFKHDKVAHTCADPDSCAVIETSKLASTGLDCFFEETEPGKWRYGLEDDFNSTHNNTEYDYYGPFGTLAQAKQHLYDNHANPGGYSIRAHPDSHAAGMHKTPQQGAEEGCPECSAVNRAALADDHASHSRFVQACPICKHQADLKTAEQEIARNTAWLERLKTEGPKLSKVAATKDTPWRDEQVCYSCSSEAERAQLVGYQEMAAHTDDDDKAEHFYNNYNGLLDALKERHKGKEVPCDTCHGEGKVYLNDPSYGTPSVIRTCPDCLGKRTESTGCSEYYPHSIYSNRKIAQDAGGGGGDGGGGGGDAGGGGGDAGAAASSGTAECGSTTDSCNNGCGGSHANAGGCTSCGCRGFLFGGYGGYRHVEHKKKKKHHKGAIEAPAGVTEGILEGDDGSLFYTNDAGATWDKIGATEHDREEEEEDDDIKLFRFDHGPGEGNDTAHSEIHQQEHNGSWGFNDDAEKNLTGTGCGRCGKQGHTSEACPSNKGSNMMPNSPQRYLSMDDFQPKEAQAFPGEDDIWRYHCTDCDYTHDNVNPDIKRCPGCGGENTVKGNFSERLRDTGRTPEWRRQNPLSSRTADHSFDDDDPTCAEGDGKKAIGSFLDNKVCDDHLRYYLADAPSQLAKAEEGIRSSASVDRLKYEDLAQKLKHDMKVGSERLAEIDREKSENDDGLHMGGLKVAADEDYEMDLNKAHHPWWFDEEGNPGYFDELPDEKCPYCGVDQSGGNIRQHVADHDRLKLDVKGKPVAPEDYDRWMNEDPDELDKKPFTGSTQEKIMYACDRCGGQATHEAVASTGARGLLCSDHSVTMKAASAAAGAGLLVFPLTKEAFDLATCPSCGDYSENHVDAGCLGTLTAHCTAKCGAASDPGQHIDLSHEGPMCECTHPIGGQYGHEQNGDCTADDCPCQVKRPVGGYSAFDEMWPKSAGMAIPDGLDNAKANGGGGYDPNCNCKGVGCALCKPQQPAMGVTAQAEMEGGYPYNSSAVDARCHLCPFRTDSVRGLNYHLEEEHDQDPDNDEHDPANDPNQEWTNVRDRRLGQVHYLHGPGIEDDEPSVVQLKGECAGPGCTNVVRQGEGYRVGDDDVCGTMCAEALMRERGERSAHISTAADNLNEEVIAYLYDNDPDEYMAVTAQNIGCPNCDHGTLPDGSICRACFGTGHGGGILLHSAIGSMQPHCADCGSHLQADEHSKGTHPMYYCGGGCGEYKQGDEIDWVDSDGNLVNSEGVTPHEAGLADLVEGIADKANDVLNPCPGGCGCSSASGCHCQGCAQAVKNAATKKKPTKKKKDDAEELREKNEDIAGGVEKVINKANGLLHDKGKVGSFEKTAITCDYCGREGKQSYSESKNPVYLKYLPGGDGMDLHDSCTKKVMRERYPNERYDPSDPQQTRFADWGKRSKTADINPAAGPNGTAPSELVDNVPALEPRPTGERNFITDHKGEVAQGAEPDKCKFCGEPMQDHAQWNPTHQPGRMAHDSNDGQGESPFHEHELADRQCMYPGCSYRDDSERNDATCKGCGAWLSPVTKAMDDIPYCTDCIRDGVTG